MKTLILLPLLAVCACATPPARHTAFAEATRAYYEGFGEEARQVRMVALPVEAAPVVVAPVRTVTVRAGARGRVGRTRRVLLYAAPVAAAPATCVAGSLSLSPRCIALERGALTELSYRHARAMAAYFSALAVLGDRFNPSLATAQLSESRDETIALGDEMLRAASIDGGTLMAFQQVPAHVGLRPAFATEMVANGWQMRRQWEIQDLTMGRLASLPGAEGDEQLKRLRTATLALRQAFERLVFEDRDALPLIAQARRALAG